MQFYDNKALWPLWEIQISQKQKRQVKSLCLIHPKVGPGSGGGFYCVCFGWIEDCRKRDANKQGLTLWESNLWSACHVQSSHKFQLFFLFLKDRAGPRGACALGPPFLVAPRPCEHFSFMTGFTSDVWLHRDVEGPGRVCLKSWSLCHPPGKCYVLKSPLSCKVSTNWSLWGIPSSRWQPALPVLNSVNLVQYFNIILVK